MTPFQTALQQDAANTFCNPAEFGQTATYTPINPSSGNPVRPVNVNVWRDPPSAIRANSNMIAPKMRIKVSSDPVLGIDPAQLDTGGDTLTIAYRIGEPPQAFRIRWPEGNTPSHDAGMLTLELR